MPHYRLREYVAGGRPVPWSTLFATPLEAVEVAERVMAALERVPHRRPYRFDVFDVWTGEPVAVVRLGVERDPDVCVACGAPSDPFATAGGMRPDGGGVLTPFPPPPPVDVEGYARERWPELMAARDDLEGDG